MADDTHTVRLSETGPSRWSNADGISASQDDPTVTGLSDSVAEYLVSTHPFERVTASQDSSESVSVDEQTPTTQETDSDSDLDSESEVDDGIVRSDSVDEADASDVDSWDDWNEDDWLSLDYQQRAADVREGRVDDHLDDVEAVETSGTVTAAVGDRRAELDTE